jgi:CBS domain-containing protein
MKSLDTLTALQRLQVVRPRRATWFEEDHEVTAEIATIGMLVREPARTVGEDAPLGDVCKLLVEQDVPAVAVVDESGALCGVITPTDLLRGLAGEEWTAIDAMSSVQSVRANTPVEAVAELLAREHAREVVVTDPVGQVVGIVSARAIARQLAAR